MEFNEEKLIKELTFKASLSGGPGGQHANKTHSRVTLEWNLEEDTIFDETQKEILRNALKSYLTKDGIFQISSEKTRSQHKNKEILIIRFIELIKTALKPRKKRKAPKPNKKFHEKRLRQKRLNAEKKANRRNPLF